MNVNLGLIKTQRARSKVKQWFKKQDRDLNIAQGKTLLDRELRRLCVTDFDLEKIAHEFDYHETDDLYEDIGCGDFSMGRIINRLSEAEKAHQQEYVETRVGVDTKKDRKRSHRSRVERHSYQPGKMLQSCPGR